MQLYENTLRRSMKIKWLVAPLPSEVVCHRKLPRRSSWSCQRLPGWILQLQSHLKSYTNRPERNRGHYLDINSGRSWAQVHREEVCLGVCVVVMWLTAPDSSSGVSNQQSVGSSPSRVARVFKRDTKPWCSFGWDVGSMCCVTRRKKNTVHLSKRGGVRPGASGLVGWIMHNSTFQAISFTYLAGKNKRFDTPLSECDKALNKNIVLLVFWFDWLHIMPQHLVNHYIVLFKGIGPKLQRVAPHIPCRKILTAHRMVYYKGINVWWRGFQPVV